MSSNLSEEEKAELAKEIRMEIDRIFNRIEDRYGEDPSVNDVLSHLILEIATLKFEIKILDEVKASKEDYKVTD